MENPCPGWLVSSTWDNISVLEELPGFQGLMESFQEHPEEWKLWFTSGEPEKTPLPGLLMESERCPQPPPHLLLLSHLCSSHLCR